MTTARIQLPKKIAEVFSHPRGSLRFRGFFGGRGSGKSFSVAKMVAVWGYAEPLRILCTREMQNSIKESFHAELKNAIASEPWLESSYDVGVDYIRGHNGTEVIFKGLRHNISSIKSMAQVDVCVVEEAADIPKSSWDALLPTIRAPGSEFLVIWNPKNKTDHVDVMLRGDSPPPRSMVVRVNSEDNPWFPKELAEQRDHDREVMDPALYAHVWQGEYYEQSDAQVFRGKFVIRDFDEPDHAFDGPYYGVDFGFSMDPTAAVKLWVKDNVLYVEHEACKVNLELDDTAPYLTSLIPGIEDSVVRADSARPESISYLQRHGIPRIQGAKKGPGSVEDGVEFIKSFKQVVIHPRCTNAASEFRLYSYKIDRLSGDITNKLMDANNHTIDAIRYALEPISKGGNRVTFSAGRRRNR